MSSRSLCNFKPIVSSLGLLISVFLNAISSVCIIVSAQSINMFRLALYILPYNSKINKMSWKPLCVWHPLILSIAQFVYPHKDLWTFCFKIYTLDLETDDIYTQYQQKKKLQQTNQSWFRSLNYHRLSIVQYNIKQGEVYCMMTIVANVCKLLLCQLCWNKV